MSSILISWRGQCPERDRRQHLVRHLRELAEVAFARFDQRYDRYDHLRYSDFDDESHWLEDAATLPASQRERHFERLKRIAP